MEEWRDVKGYEGLYRVSTLGNVQSNYKRGMSIGNLKPNTGTNGYLYVHLHKDKHRKSCAIHQLVATAFLENTENKPQVNHINFTKTDNRLVNLEWATRSENQLHSYRNSSRRSAMFGRYGLDNPLSKPVKQIDSMGNVVAEFHGHREAERMTGISSAKISLCVAGKRKTTGGFAWK